jgi:hypothetical protein
MGIYLSLGRGVVLNTMAGVTGWRLWLMGICDGFRLSMSDILGSLVA